MELYLYSKTLKLAFVLLQICEINTSIRNFEEKYETDLKVKITEANQMRDELKNLQNSLKEIEK